MRTHNEEGRNMEEKIKKRMVNEIENAAISLIKNAESIIGDYEYRCDQPLCININIEPYTKVTEISFQTTFFPERIATTREGEAHDIVIK